MVRDWASLFRAPSQEFLLNVRPERVRPPATRGVTARVWIGGLAVVAVVAVVALVVGGAVWWRIRQQRRTPSDRSDAPLHVEARPPVDETEVEPPAPPLPPPLEVVEPPVQPVQSSAVPFVAPTPTDDPPQLPETTPESAVHLDDATTLSSAEPPAHADEEAAPVVPLLRDALPVPRTLRSTREVFMF
jgi:cytoskeletal protein RodZ